MLTYGFCESPSGTVGSRKDSNKRHSECSEAAFFVMASPLGIATAILSPLTKMLIHGFCLNGHLPSQRRLDQLHRTPSLKLSQQNHHLRDRRLRRKIATSDHTNPQQFFTGLIPTQYHHTTGTLRDVQNNHAPRYRIRKFSYEPRQGRRISRPVRLQHNASDIRSVQYAAHSLARDSRK